MKRLIIIGIVISFFALSGWGQNRENISKDPFINFGVKAGFNSSMFTVSDFKIRDVTINEIQNTYKIGYFGSVFMRINIGAHYIQPEASYQISRCQIGFDKLGSHHPELEPDYAYINSKLHSIEIPVLYGFNIIKSGPYGLSVFAGPKFKYLWSKRNKISFENLDQEIEEKLHPLNLSLTAGVGVNISRIFFDFRYELGLNNISKEVNYVNQPESPENGRDIVFNRRENVLSFSFGVMF
ncbi:MAG: PorT family protein [Bacteroides sp.]|nr:PorT family protein [Bacteroides sp.]